MRKFGKVLAASLLALGAHAAGAAAQEQCAEATVGVCYLQHGSIASVTATPSGFAAAAVGPAGIDILDLDGEGEEVSRRRLAQPSWLAQERAEGVEVQRLVGASGDRLFVIGYAVVGPANRRTQVGVFGTVLGDGSVRWSPPLRMSQETSIILYSGLWDEASQRLIMVGRHTNGSDNGRCAFWSQGLVLSMPQTGQPSVNAVGAQQAGPRNRIAFYDIAPTGEGDFVVAGFGTAPGREAGTCQDNALAMRIGGGTDGRWNNGEPIAIGTREAGEVAFAVGAGEGGRHVIAGHGAMPGGTRAALLASVPLSGGEPSVVHHAYPDEGDAGGGDRYRAMVTLPGGSHLVAGSSSASRQGRNQGVWRVVGAALDGGVEQYLTQEAGSDILGVAVGAGGTVLAVGTHGDGRGNVGWMGVIHGSGVTVVAAGERRQPDPALPAVTPAEAAAGSLTLSERELAAGVGLRGGAVAAGQGFEFRFPLSRPTEVSVRGLPASGDFDLALLDGEGRLVAYSSNLDDAGEYLGATLPAGDYRLRLVAVADVSAYEVRLAVGAPHEAAVASGLASLDVDGRKALSARLLEAGYGASGNPDIGFGAATVRSLIAWYGTYHATLEPAGIAGFAMANAAFAE